MQGDPLWSARMIKTNPGAISAVHTRYTCIVFNADDMELICSRVVSYNSTV